MAVIYSMPTKAARMQAVCDMMAGGTLELGTTDMAVVLATILLPVECCTSQDDCVTAAPIQGAYAVAIGTIEQARVRGPQGQVVIDGLTVGKSKQFDVVADHPRIQEIGQIVTAPQVRFRHA